MVARESGSTICSRSGYVDVAASHAREALTFMAAAVRIRRERLLGSASDVCAACARNRRPFSTAASVALRNVDFFFENPL